MIVTRLTIAMALIAAPFVVSAQSLTREHAAALATCLNEGAEMVKTGMFFKLGWKKSVVLTPPRYTTGTPENRRLAIVEQVYKDEPPNWRRYAFDHFNRCIKGNSIPARERTLELCFDRHALITEIFIAKQGAVPKANALGMRLHDNESPTTARWREDVTATIYESDTPLPEYAWWAFLGCYGTMERS